MRIGRKKESLLGIAITAVLCLGFLWWWFRPRPKTWQDEKAEQLIARALAEPRPGDRVQLQVIDLDLLEIAFSQARGGQRAEARATAGHIADPVIRRIAAEKLASAWMNTDPADFSEALTFAELANGTADRNAVRTEIVSQLAAIGFADAAIPEARTPLQKATLAVRMKDADEKARELLSEAATALPSLAPDDAAAVRKEIARARVRFSITDGPDAAIAAIRELPEGQRGELWTELIGWCQGREDKAITVPLVAQQVEDPVLRRRLEIESLLFDVKLRPAEVLISECRAAVDQAAVPEAKTAALLTLAAAQYNDRSGPGQEAAAAETLKAAYTSATTVAVPETRSRMLLAVSRELSNVLNFDASRAALKDAVTAARAMPDAAKRVALLLTAADEAFKQADEPGALQLIDEAAQGLDAAPESSDPAALEALAVALIRRGNWPAALARVHRISDGTLRLAALKTAVTTAAEDCTSVDPGNPPSRGEVLDRIRRTALTDQVAAANLTEAQPEGFARARGWLAMAKATIQPPSSLTDYMMSGAQPADESPGDEGGLPDEKLPSGDDTMEDPVKEEP